MKRRSFLQWSGYFGGAALATRFPGLQAALAQSGMPMTMQLDWVFNVQFAGLLLADHLGLYEQKGLTPDLKPWSSGLLVPDAVAASPMMIGCSEQSLILDAQAKGMPLKAIATMFQASPYALMTLPDSGLTTLTDLIGKRVGVHSDGVPIMQLVMGVSGLAPTDIEVVEIPYENKLDRLITGELDALQCYAVDEPIAFTQRVGEEALILPMDDYGYKAYAQVFFTSDALLEQHPDQVKAFLEASFEGWRMALADIPGTAQLVAETYAEAGSKYTNVEYQTQSLALVGEYVMKGIEVDQLGTMSVDQWQHTAELMAEYGIIAAAPDLSTSLDLSLWSGLTPSGSL